MSKMSEMRKMIIGLPQYGQKKLDRAHLGRRFLPQLKPPIPTGTPEAADVAAGMNDNTKTG
jgi:hypothetical protein